MGGIFAPFLNVGEVSSMREGLGLLESGVPVLAQPIRKSINRAGRKRFISLLYMI